MERTNKGTLRITDYGRRDQAPHVAALCHRNVSHNSLAHVQNGPQTAADILGLPDNGKGSRRRNPSLIGAAVGRTLQ